MKPQRRDRFLLQDMLDAAREIIQETPATAALFHADKFRSAYILRQIQIIGEAAWRIARPIKDQHPAIPWNQIEAMRHVLVHDYFKVNWDRVFETASRDVPKLKPQIEMVLASLPLDHETPP
jgi:uncharacterized protein with HEPN domain